MTVAKLHFHKKQLRLCRSFYPLHELVQRTIGERINSKNWFCKRREDFLLWARWVSTHKKVECLLHPNQHTLQARESTPEKLCVGSCCTTIAWGSSENEQLRFRVRVENFLLNTSLGTKRKNVSIENAGHCLVTSLFGMKNSKRKFNVRITSVVILLEKSCLLKTLEGCKHQCVWAIFAQPLKKIEIFPTKWAYKI